MKWFLFLLIPLVGFAKPPILSEEECSELITVICTTNPIPSIPKTDILYESMKSLDQISAFRKCKKIIVFDGIQPGYEHRTSDYDTYKQNIQELANASPYFINTELVFCPTWVHLAGAIAHALESVTTPYLFIHQHDFQLLKPFDLPKLLTSMQFNPNIKYVRLNAYRKNRPERKTGQHYRYDGDVDRVILGGSLIPLSRTFGWSDNDHIARTDYYRDFVLPSCEFGAMEWFLHPMLKESIKKNGQDGHLSFGTYLYGDLDDGKYLHHLDGRR